MTTKAKNPTKGQMMTMMMRPREMPVKPEKFKNQRKNTQAQGREVQGLARAKTRRRGLIRGIRGRRKSRRAK